MAQPAGSLVCVCMGDKCLGIQEAGLQGKVTTASGWWGGGTAGFFFMHLGGSWSSGLSALDIQ